MPMTTANKLTLVRVFLIPVFLVVAYLNFTGHRYVALAVFIIASLTDLLDGYIARHYNQVSDFGKFADPLADKCLVMAALCWFVETGEMFGWILAVVLLREFAVSGMRLVRQDQDRQHHGVHLSDDLLRPGAPLAEPGVPGRHPGDHRLLRRGVFHQELGRVPGVLTHRKNPVTIASVIS